MSKPVNRIGITRREALLLSTTVGLGAALSKPVFGSDSVKTGAHQEPGNVSTPRSAIAKTQYGKVRGFVDGGVLTFKGVPYGATTAGQNRRLSSLSPNGSNFLHSAVLLFTSSVASRSMRDSSQALQMFDLRLLPHLRQMGYLSISSGSDAPSTDELQLRLRYHSCVHYHVGDQMATTEHTINDAIAKVLRGTRRAKRA